MKAVVLAAGRGTRLRPLTDRIPKPLVEVGGRPLVEHVLEGLRRAGADRVLIVIGYLGDQIRAALGGGEDWGLCLEYAVQAEQRGTGHAALIGAEFAGGEPWLMSFGDVLTEKDAAAGLVELAGRHPGCHALAVKAVPEAWTGGVVALDGERVLRIVEKPIPAEAPSDLVNAGLFYFLPDLAARLAHLPLSARGELELTAALAELAAEDRLRACRLAGFWSDVGTPASLEAARRWAAGGEG